jgi:hypothetical protein
MRVVSGGDIDGVVFRFETWKNNKEDESVRVESGGLWNWPDMALQSFLIAARRSFGWMGFDSSSKS